MKTRGAASEGENMKNAITARDREKKIGGIYQRERASAPL